jgi:type IV secretory pathway TrbL component
VDLGSILSGPIGALFGAAGAIAGKVLDYKSKQLEHAHALAMRDKDREQLAMELANKSEVARVEADQQVAMREFDSVAAAIAADRATYGDSRTGKIVDLVRGLTRPAITFLSMLLIGWMTVRVLRGGADLSAFERVGLLREALFIAGVAITWWFGARPSGGRSRA